MNRIDERPIKAYWDSIIGFMRPLADERSISVVAREYTLQLRYGNAVCKGMLERPEKSSEFPMHFTLESEAPGKLHFDPIAEISAESIETLSPEDVARIVIERLLKYQPRN
jgi:hypothetical protein